MGKEKQYVWVGNGVVDVRGKPYYKGDIVPIETINKKVLAALIARGELIEAPKTKTEPKGGK